MFTLTRRRDRSLPQECWRIYYGDVHAGTIAQCVGNPGAAPKWQWRCGFYPGSRPGECSNGNADTLEIARADFEAGWRVFLAKRTEADFQAWREQQAWTAEKNRRFNRGELGRRPLLRAATFFLPSRQNKKAAGVPCTGRNSPMQ